MLKPRQTHDGHAGMHSFPGNHFEVFWTVNGWFWWACLPGCLPDSDPVGPFNTSRQAYLDAKNIPLNPDNELTSEHMQWRKDNE